MADTGRFTVGVFQDVEWARKGVEALLNDGFVPESLTIMAKDTPAAAALGRVWWPRFRFSRVAD